MSRKYSSKFQEEWLNPAKFPQYATWLRKDKNTGDAYCVLCKRGFTVASLGKSAVDSHAIQPYSRFGVPNGGIEKTVLKVAFYLVYVFPFLQLFTFKKIFFLPQIISFFSSKSSSKPPRISFWEKRGNPEALQNGVSHNLVSSKR